MAVISDRKRKLQMAQIMQNIFGLVHQGAKRMSRLVSFINEN